MCCKVVGKYNSTGFLLAYTKLLLGLVFGQGWRLRSSVRKLQRSQSHIMTTYYVFLWVISALNLLRCAVQLGQAQLVNNALWNGFLIFARFGAVSKHHHPGSACFPSYFLRAGTSTLTSCPLLSIVLFILRTPCFQKGPYLLLRCFASAM